MNIRTLILAALIALPVVSTRADTFVTITPTGATAATVVNRWTIGSGLSGLSFIDGNSGFGGATATNFFSLTGAAIPALGAPAGFTSYIAASGVATTQGSVGNNLTPLRYSGLTYVAENLSLIGPLSFYTIHHRATGDYLALIQPSVPTVSDHKPMSAPGNSLTPGASGYFALSYAADNPGGWGAQLFYYLRENGLGETVFGSMIPALLSGPTDRWNLGANRGFTDLAYTSVDVGFGFGPMQFYYLRLDPGTQTSFFGHLNPLTGVATDIQNLGGVFRTLVFTPTNVTFGANNFYSIRQSAQTITFGAIADRTACDLPFTFVAPVASSGLAVTLAVTGPATISAGNLVTLTGGTGTVTITASQAGNVNFDAAVSVAQSFDVVACAPSLTAQTVSFAPISDRTACDAPFNFALPVATSGLPVTLAITGPASISAGNVITLTGAVGTVSITASQAGDADFSAAPDVVQTFSVAICPPPPSVPQSITFAPVSDQTLCEDTLTLNPTASSGLPVVLSVVSGPATVVGHVVTFTGAGTVTLQASQAGNGTYSSATSVTRTFTVEKCVATITLSHLTKTYYGVPFNPLDCVIATTNPPGLTVAITYNGTTQLPTVVGSYTVVATIVDARYTGTATATFVLSADARVAQTVSFGVPTLANRVLGDGPFTLSPNSSTGMPTSLVVVSGPATVTGNTVTPTGIGTVVLEVAQAGDIATALYASNTQSFVVTAAPMITAQPLNTTAAAGGQTTFSVGATSPTATYQWQLNGQSVAGATGSTLTLTNAQSNQAGVYTALISDQGAVWTSNPAIMGISSTDKVGGAAAEVGFNIQHANGNVYDQVLLQGAAATLTADAGQIVRMSFVDLTGDIVQVEFSGAGTLALTLDNASGPAPAQNYNQPGVSYMRGHARIVVAGANETTHLSVFSVGRITALNQAIFRDEVAYDGWADLASISILSADGKFGSLRAGNATFSGTQSLVGVHAPGVVFAGAVVIGNVTAFDAASPRLEIGGALNTRVAGGDMNQPNGSSVRVSGITDLEFVGGASSHGVLLLRQVNGARYDQSGIDVTTQVLAQP